MDVLFAAAGIGLIIAALLGETTISGFTPPVPKTGKGRALGAALGGLCLVVSFALNGRIPFPPPPPPPTPVPTTASHSPPAKTAAPAEETDGPTGSVSPVGCVLTIANSLATMHEDTSMFSSEDKVPAGEYVVSDTKSVDFGGAKQRWFQISVGSNTGWILDDPFFVESKSADCP
jgi:hypothetical protein